MLDIDSICNDHTLKDACETPETFFQPVYTAHQVLGVDRICKIILHRLQFLILPVPSDWS